MDTLDYPGDFQSTMGMGQPVQINAKGGSTQLRDEVLDVESFILEHAHRDIDDTNPNTLSLEIFRNG
jgi:hypothetical protein